MALLPAVSAHFGDRHALDSNLNECAFNLFQPVGLNDGFDFCHLVLVAIEIMKLEAEQALPPGITRDGSTGEV